MSMVFCFQSAFTKESPLMPLGLLMLLSLVLILL